MGHQTIDILQAHALFDGPFHAHQTDAVLILKELANRTNTAVAKVIDVINRPLAVPQINEVTDDLEYILLCQGRMIKRRRKTKFIIDLESPDRRKVVTLGIKKEAFKEGRRTAYGWRITGAEAAVNLDNRILGRIDAILQQGFAQIRTDIEIVDKENLDLLDLPSAPGHLDLR